MPARRARSRANSTYRHGCCGTCSVRDNDGGNQVHRLPRRRPQLASSTWRRSSCRSPLPVFMLVVDLDRPAPGTDPVPVQASSTRSRAIDRSCGSSAPASPPVRGRRCGRLAQSSSAMAQHRPRHRETCCCVMRVRASASVDGAVQFTGEDGRPGMRARTLPIVLALSLLSGLNAIALIANLTQPSRAAVGGMSYQELCAIRTLHARLSRSRRTAR